MTSLQQVRRGLTNEKAGLTIWCFMKLVNGFWCLHVSHSANVNKFTPNLQYIMSWHHVVPSCHRY